VTSPDSRTLIVYFSATGTTHSAAKKLQKATGADIVRSGISGSMGNIRKYAKGAAVRSGKDLTDESQSDINTWAAEQ
jgi:hypothetical protein